MFTRHRALAAALAFPIFLGGCASSPAYEGVAGDQLFALGAQSFDEEDWGKAVEVFERLIFAEPTFERIVEARMYLARAYYNQGEFITSSSEFTRILDRHPGHELAPEASLGICQSFVAQSPHVQRDQQFTVQAWNACQNTLSDFSGHPVAQEAQTLRDEMEDKLAEKFFIAGDFYYRRSLYHSGIIYFNELLDRFPRNVRWAPEALLRLHQSYSRLDWGMEATEVRDRLLREFPDSEAADRIRASGDPGGDVAEGSGERSPGSGGPGGVGGGTDAPVRTP